jgi:hypothetical protein
MSFINVLNSYLSIRDILEDRSVSNYLHNTIAHSKLYSIPIAIIKWLVSSHLNDPEHVLTTSFLECLANSGG